MKEAIAVLEAEIKIMEDRIDALWKSGFHPVGTIGELSGMKQAVKLLDRQGQ